MTYQLPALPAPDVPDIYEKSNETMQWLRDNIRVGFTTERGPAWWANVVTKAGSFTEIPDGSHFAGPVPMEEVERLLSVPLAKGTVHVTYEDENGVRQVATDPGVQPIVNIRSGKVFSYPTSKYRIHPYLETLSDFIQAIQYDQAVACGSVGLLKNGGQAFLQARLPETLTVEGYEYVPYLMGVTSADLSRATWYATGFEGAICDNTVRGALEKALSQFKIRHTSNSGLAVAAARGKLGLQLHEVGEAIGEQISALCQVKVSDKDFALWLDEMAPPKEPDPKSSTGGAAYTNTEAKRAEYTRLWNEDPKVAPWKGRGFGILQLDNTYRTWGEKIPQSGGGILERNFARVADGRTAKADALALDTLAKVLQAA